MNGRRVTLVIPVLNEERQLPWSVWRLREVMDRIPGVDWDLVIADNGSSDRTWDVVRMLESSGKIRGLRLDRRGRGGALRTAWLASGAEILAYLDVDLSTDPVHLRDLLHPLWAGTADVVVGSRLAAGARVIRGWRRECLSQCYNRLARMLTRSRVSDHQCGFKALTRCAAEDLVPRIHDRSWFFDTELLVLAQRRGWRVREIPVRWVDDPDSRVRILATIVEDLQGLWRLRGG